MQTCATPFLFSYLGKRGHIGFCRKVAGQDKSSLGDGGKANRDGPKDDSTMEMLGYLGPGRSPSPWHGQTYLQE